MSKFQKASKEIAQFVNEVLFDWDVHQPLIDAKVKLDVCMAYGDQNDAGETEGVAIKRHGQRVLGLAKIIGLKDRAMGRGDAEIMLDGDWWEDATDEQKKALVDHELFHLRVKDMEQDDLGRPKLEMRLHDYEFGWFKAVAERHGENSIEQQQARLMMDTDGQFFWPEFEPAPAAVSKKK